LSLSPNARTPLELVNTVLQDAHDGGVAELPLDIELELERVMSEDIIMSTAVGVYY